MMTVFGHYGYVHMEKLSQSKMSRGNKSWNPETSSHNYRTVKRWLTNHLNNTSNSDHKLILNVYTELNLKHILCSGSVHTFPLDLINLTQKHLVIQTPKLLLLNDESTQHQCVLKFTALTTWDGAGGHTRSHNVPNTACWHITVATL